MEKSPTAVVIGDSHFDVAAIGNWLASNIYLFLLVASVAFIFFIFQKGGFAEKFLESRTRARELDAKMLDDARVLADILLRKYDRDDPMLPFDKRPEPPTK